MSYVPHFGRTFRRLSIVDAQCIVHILSSPEAQHQKSGVGQSKPYWAAMAWQGPHPETALALLTFALWKPLFLLFLQPILTESLLAYSL